MKKILLWDPRFPDRAPARFTVDDAVASAAVRAGVAAAADPTEAGLLAAGAPVSAASLVLVLLQHGTAQQRLDMVVLPLAVAQIGAGIGLIASAAAVLGSAIPANAILKEDGTPLLNEDGSYMLLEDPVLAPLSLSPGSASVGTNTAAGTQVFAISGVPAGVTPTLSPNDGRFVIAGNGTTGWTVNVGLSALSAGSVSLTISASGAIAATGAVAITSLIDPYNAEAVWFGDSRTYQAGTSLTSLAANGLPTWMPRFVGNSFKLPDTGTFNYGLSGQTVEQATSIPRLGDATLGLDKIAAAPQAIVFMLNGTNSSDIGPGGTARAAMTSAIDYLTNPASTAYPGYGGKLYQSKPKTLIILNELPRGIDETGAAQNPYPTLSTWADWISKFSYDSGDALANPHVIVVNTYYDPRLLDVSSGAAHSNKRGTLYDGLHNNAAGASLVAQIVGDRLRQIPFFQVDRGYATLPTAGTVGNFLNANPMNTTGSVGPATVTPTGAVPDGIVIIAGGGTSIAFSDDTYPGGKIATITTSSYDAVEFRFPLMNGSYAAGDKLQMVAKLGLTTAVNGSAVEIGFALRGSSATPDLECGLCSVSDPTNGAATSALHASAGHVVNGAVADFAPVTVVTPPLDTTPIGAPVFGWSAGNGSYGRIFVGCGPGTTTLRLGPVGIRKV